MPAFPMMRSNNKKKDQANMVTQLKAGRKKLQEAKEAGTNLPLAELEDLERRDNFLKEYEALGLYNPRKTELLLQWKQDKSLKTWAEVDSSHSTFTRGTDRSEKSYGTLRLGCISFLLFHFCYLNSFLKFPDTPARYDVAKMMNLDPSDKIQKKLLDKALAKLDQDFLWDDTNPLEAVYKEEEMVRYSWKKNMGQLMESGIEDAAKVRATKDATKKLAKGGMLTDAASSSSNPAPEVKLEHVWVLPTKNTKEEMRALLQKARALSNAYKRFKVQLDTPDIVKIMDCLNQLDTELLKRTLENTESFSGSST